VPLRSNRRDQLLVAAAFTTASLASFTVPARAQMRPLRLSAPLVADLSALSQTDLSASPGRAGTGLTGASVPDSVRRVTDHRRLGGWIGFGVGAVTGTILAASCGSDSHYCSTQSRLTYGVGVLVGSTLLGSLIGRQFHR
jgi:hypothetical protein